jgi:Tfp pilus assembly protein PilF
LKDAEPLYRRALEARQRTLGAEPPDTVARVKILAGCFQAVGRLKDAEPLYRRALEARERTLGAAPPDTLV